MVGQAFLPVPAAAGHATRDRQKYQSHHPESLAEKSVGQAFLPVPSWGVIMNEWEVVVRRRHLPHWTLTGSDYFVTFCLLRGELAPSERGLVVDHLRSGHERFYDLHAAVVMPDHVHLLLTPGDGYPLPRVMKGVKGVSAKRLNEWRGTAGTVWQDESWDRIVHDADEFSEKLGYVENNPVRAGLVAAPADYPWLWINPALGQAEMPVPANPEPTRG